MSVYYNEHDPKTAAWLRELIKANLIAPGKVDERSIEDVLPSELDGFTQCHFFAGIGVWSYALRCAGWPDDRKVWTGSCPCQPFSAAGKGGGTDDERHLWPSFFWLIKQCQPPVIFGEQVASKDGLAWLDIVQSDLEAEKYAVAPFDLCAAGFGAPHIRQRLFFVADTSCNDQQGIRQSGARNGRRELPVGRHGSTSGLADADGQQADAANKRGFHPESISGCDAGGLADAASQRYDGRRTSEESGRTGEFERSRDAGELGNAAINRRKERQREDGQPNSGSGSESRIHAFGTGATNGFWRNAEWLYCRDGKFRAVEPGTFPLADGAPARVGRLRGYGNAIAAPAAQAFIESYMEAAA